MNSLKTQSASPFSAAPYFVAGATTLGGELAGAGDQAVLLVEQDELSWSTLLGGDEEELRELPLPDALDLAAADPEAPQYALDDVEAWRRLSLAAHDALEWRTARYDTTPLGQLSPGSAVRAYLAVALNRRSVRLLLLDEPTNHLDLPSILWLQHTLLASGKAVVMVSHDAAFLDAVADHIWYIDPYEHSLTTSNTT